MLSAISLMIIPAAVYINHVLFSPKTLQKAAVYILLIISILVNFPNMIIDPGRWSLIGNRYELFDRAQLTNDLTYSPVAASWNFLLSCADNNLGAGSHTMVISSHDGKKTVPVSLKGYDQCYIWSYTILKGEVSRYSGETQILDFGPKIKIMVAGIMFMLVAGLIFGVYLIIRFVYKEPGH